MLLPAFTAIFLPIILGMLCRSGNFINPLHRPVIQQFAVRVTIPFMVFNSLRSIELSTAEQFVPLTIGLLLFMGIIWLISWGFLLLANRIIWIRKYRAELLLMAYAGNIGYICWKLQEILIGPAGLQRGIFYTAFYWPFLMLYAFATVFVLGLHKSHGLNKREIAYNLAPLLLMIFLGLTLGIRGVEIPSWLDDFSIGFGGMGIPLTLFCMGLSISLRKAFKSVIPLLPYLLIRSLIWIGISLLMIRMPFYDEQSIKVLMINSLAPLAINPIIISDMFGLDTEFVANSTTVSTVFFLLGLPLLFLFW